MNRRQMLRGAGLAAGAAVVNAVAQNAPAAPPSRKYKIIVTGGHPGDPEYGCGGTVARLTALGHDVVLLYLNDGGWETAAAVRMAEAKKACDILKARPAYAGQANGRPAEAAGVMRDAERFRLARDQCLLDLQGGFDAGLVAVWAHDRKDLVAHAEGDVDLPRHLLLDLRQAQRNPTQIVAGHSGPLWSAPLAVPSLPDGTPSVAVCWSRGGSNRTRAIRSPSNRSIRAR